MLINLIAFLNNFNKKNHLTTSKTNSFFLRKSRLFVKSRFSRNRQWSKSIIYFGVWFNILSIFWGTFFCYKYFFMYTLFFWIIISLTALVVVKHFLRNLNWFNLNWFKFLFPGTY